MNGNPLRWADAGTAAAWYDLRELAPRLSGLMYSTTIPDQLVSVLLDWSEAVTAPDCSEAFTLDRLRAVLPALVRAFIAGHTYALGERWDTGGDVVELYDTGCGSMVGRAMGLAGLMATALHGAEGRELVEGARAELASTLSRIHELMLSR
jgi:hypothetical protein